ncbi:MAG: type II toxin-antitoxin system RelE/ParE family toxin [Candidatus Symbiobacter sp.]|nr:type II toxin-antitoxin system RelE/ParE family toxin [Candidatus Symbiobacter sp.]
MIIRFRHRGLKLLYDSGDHRLLQPQLAAKISRILARLDVIETPQDMDLPGYYLHKLSGDLKNFWSVRVTGNWRIIFQVTEDGIDQVDLTDYH